MHGLKAAIIFAILSFAVAQESVFDGTPVDPFPTVLAPAGNNTGLPLDENQFNETDYPDIMEGPPFSGQIQDIPEAIISTSNSNKRALGIFSPYTRTVPCIKKGSTAEPAIASN